jgi:choline dehydrogenase-like flavoprotein
MDGCLTEDVVDSDANLRVFGVKSLSMADALVFPNQTARHKTATIIAPRESATDVILGKVL